MCIRDRDEYFLDVINKLGLKDKVVVTGYLSNQELHGLFRGMKGLIFPSLFEGFGIPVVEAMYFHKLIASSNLTSLPEIGCDSIFYFNPKKPDEVLDAINYLFRHEMTFEMTEDYDKKLVEYHPQIMIQKYMDVFKLAIANRRSDVYKRQQPFIRTLNADGINLVGNFKAETGLGQSCRLVADEIIASGISCSLYQYEQLGIMAEGQYGDYEEKVSSNLPHNINVLHINPHEIGLAFMQNHEKIWNGRYNIGFWLWELEEFPEQWTPCFHCVDEIWTPSEFITNAVRKKTSLPVVTIPYHIEASVKGNYNRSDFSLPDNQFLFLMMYDRTSMTKRKNPEGVIKAFKKAFKPNENVGLVIKINNCLLYTSQHPCFRRTSRSRS